TSRDFNVRSSAIIGRSLYRFDRLLNGRLYSLTEAAPKPPLKFQRQFFGTFIELVLSAMNGHGLAGWPGRSIIGSTQNTAIRPAVACVTALVHRDGHWATVGLSRT
ncbi:hypothetical protein, partial [Paraburkholderia sp. UCT31]|uniref:hypothetical protein n=1 Tax=Paraburkholderia sp. UCT31 TaxID=2615209 RepID=UPI001CA408AC